MTLTLHFHPLSSFCQKALIGLYELEVPFEKRIVDLQDETQRAQLLELWPMGKFPVLEDEARGMTVPESTVLLEYVERRYAKQARLIPADQDRAHECRLRDRFFDLYMNVPMGKIVADKLRPPDKHDPYGVDQARDQLEAAYRIADDWMRGGPWAGGESFTLADCAAAPALYYANRVLPFKEEQAHLRQYFARLSGRPSFARVMDEAKPYLAMFPG